MKKIVLILIFLSSVVVANECISFEGVKNKNAVMPIITELNKLSIDAKINAFDKCKYHVYMPIAVYIKNDSGVRNISVLVDIQKKSEIIKHKNIQIIDTNNEFVDLTQNKKDIKNIFIEKHAHIIAFSLKNELF